MPTNFYGQKTNDKGEVIYEFGPNAGKTATEVRALAENGGAGSSYITDPNTGRTQVTETPNLLGQQNQITQEQMRLKAQLDAEASKKRLDALQSTMSSYGGGPQVTHPGMGNQDALFAAQFAKQKDLQGQSALGALQSMRDQLSSRGMLGSTMETGATGRIVSNAQQGISNAGRDLMAAQAARQGQIDDQTYQGNITQRGQNQNYQQALLQLIGGLY